MIVKCLVCFELIPYTKEQVRRHSARFHDYTEIEYEQYHRQMPLTREEKAEIVAKGEKRLGLHHFIGFGA